MTIAPRPAGPRRGPGPRRDREGADLSTEGPARPGTGPPRHRHDRVPHARRAGRQGCQPRGPRRPATIPCPGGSSSRAPATFAGSPSRPCPSSTFTRSTTGARETRASRPPGQARPDCCSRPATGRTATSITSIPSARRFHSSEPYGTAFVPAVFLRFNPFWPDPEPFLSEYHGTLRISRAGTYRFFTSSQDCSFLLIDGKVVVSAPGRHGPVHDARIKGEVNLTAGTHDFQYLHAAAGADACMVAAWQPPGAGKPEPIPPEAFGAEAIASYPAVGVKHLREYAVDIAGEVPLAESDQPLVRVQFRSVSSRASASRPKVHWDFGDGQTSTPERPGPRLPPSGPLHGDDEGLGRGGIPGGRQPRADPPRPGLRRRVASARRAGTLPGDPRQVQSREARSRGTAPARPRLRAGRALSQGGQGRPGRAPRGT